MSMSFTTLGCLSRCARANSDRYSIIRNFFHLQPTVTWPRTLPSLIERRHFHLSPALHGKRNRYRTHLPPFTPNNQPRRAQYERFVEDNQLLQSSSEDLVTPRQVQDEICVEDKTDQQLRSSPQYLDGPQQVQDERVGNTNQGSQIPEDLIPPAETNTQNTTERSAEKEVIPSTKQAPSAPLAYNFNNYSRFFRQLASSLPHLHRPTRDDFLNVASGFWERTRVRFKWFTIKSFRKFNSDDISAFISMFLMSQTLWILVGTTTFFSVVFAIANGLGLQHLVARAASSYLTSETGVTIIFESAIVPKWKDFRISFKNVYVSRRTSSAPRSQTIDHYSAVGYDVSNHPANHGFEEDEYVQVDAEDIPNVSEFDLTIGSIDVTLSLWRWLDGRGLIEDAVIKGVRGILDRRMITWDLENPYDPADFRHKAQPGDFELDSLQVEDVLITVYQPGEFRPFTASIFRADIRTFRKRWLFYDFLCAENVVGQFDGCLVSLHKPQSIGRTTEMDLQDGDWARMSRIRIDGVNVDHLQRSSTEAGGPISWITSGKVDAVLDIKFPRDPNESIQLNDILEEIADRITTSLGNPLLDRIPGQRALAKPPLSAPEEVAADPTQKVTVDIDLRFRDIKAALPIFPNEISYVNNALVRPIIAFMNSNRTLVPIHCRMVKDIDDFDGSWNLWDCGLMDEMAVKMYDALAYHVAQVNMNKRVKVIGIWSLQKSASVVLSAMRAAVDPVASHFRENYLNSRQYHGLGSL